MPTHVAFLRGINVSNRRATSEQLCSCLAAVGLRDVATFRASGNVVFSSDRAADDEAQLAARVEEALTRSLGFAVPVFLRAADELGAIAAHEPFPAADVEASAGKLQVQLLASPPTAAARRAVLALSTDSDRLAIRGRELYWLPSGRMADSGLELKTVDTILGLGTMRTKGTVEMIAAKYFGD